MAAPYFRYFVNNLIFLQERVTIYQVEATTAKRAVVGGQDRPCHRATGCPEKTGRPVSMQ